MAGTIKLKRPQALYARDIATMMSAGTTFREVAENDSEPLTRRARVLKVWKEIAEQLDVLFNVSALRSKPVPDAALKQLGDARLAARQEEAHPDDPSAVAPVAVSDDAAEPQRNADLDPEDDPAAPSAAPAAPLNEGDDMNIDNASDDPSAQVVNEDGMPIEDPQTAEYREGLAAEEDDEGGEIDDSVYGPTGVPFDQE